MPKKSQTYNKISKHLSDEEHVLLRPSMFIGSVSLQKFNQYVGESYEEIEYVPGLLKLVNEILDNSVDIAIKTNFEYGNKINIKMTYDYVQIEDNGTGIPVVKTKDNQGKDVWNPVLSWTYTKAGTNFEEDETRISMGMNGVGSTAVSIFSKVFIGETADGSKKLKLKTVNNNKLEDVAQTRSKMHFTKVYFEPDFQRFGVYGFDMNHIKVIKDRVEKLAALYPEITFTFNDEKIKFKQTREYLKVFKDQELDIIHSSSDDINLSIVENNNEEFRYISVVNGLNTVNGGSHLDYICEEIINHLRPAIEKKYKFKVVPSQIKQHLMIVLFAKNFPNLMFDSQTKERITNNKQDIVNYFKDIDFEFIAKQILKHEKIIKPIIEYQLAKLEQAEKRKIAAEQKRNSKEKVAKHIEPNSKDFQKNILYLVEGDSAKGNFMIVRDKKYHGIYPLKGKFLNVSQKNDLDILKNEECKDLMNILGLKLNSPVPDKMIYNKIYITADADMDGYCITTQLLNFFNIWPELFERKIIYILKTPIMVVKKNNKTTQVFYTMKDYENYTMKAGEKIKYLKGLGSLNENEYKEFLIDKPMLELIHIDEHSKNALDIIFGDDADKRKEWLK